MLPVKYSHLETVYNILYQQITKFGRKYFNLDWRAVIQVGCGLSTAQTKLFSYLVERKKTPSKQQTHNTETDLLEETFLSSNSQLLKNTEKLISILSEFRNMWFSVLFYSGKLFFPISSEI